MSASDATKALNSSMQRSNSRCTRGIFNNIDSTAAASAASSVMRGLTTATPANSGECGDWLRGAAVDAAPTAELAVGVSKDADADADTAADANRLRRGASSADLTSTQSAALALNSVMAALWMRTYDDGARARASSHIEAAA